MATDPVRMQVSIRGPKKVLNKLSREELEAIVKHWANTGDTPGRIEIKSVVWSNPGRSKVKDRTWRTGDTEEARKTLRRALQHARISFA